MYVPPLQAVRYHIPGIGDGRPRIVPVANLSVPGPRQQRQANDCRSSVKKTERHRYIVNRSAVVGGRADVGVLMCLWIEPRHGARNQNSSLRAEEGPNFELFTKNIFRLEWIT